MGTGEQVDKRRRAPTGIEGLDELLGGGFPDERIYLVTGGPGTGKTTFAMQFLLEGVRRGESTLYISLLQTREELMDLMRSHGWVLDGINLLELPADIREEAEAEQTVFSPADVELDEVVDAIVGAIREHEPQRVVLDSLTELQIVVDTPYQLRRHLLKLKRALMDTSCTSLLTSDETMLDLQPTMRTVVHGVVSLRRHTPAYGEPMRGLEVEKVRGIRHAGGLHDFVLRTGGLEVFPRLGVAGPVGTALSVVSSGNAELDALFHGGLHAGTACLVMGTSGAGKSTLASLYAAKVAEGGEAVSIYCFDESRQTYLCRSRGLGLGITEHVEEGLIHLRDYNVGDLTPGELMQDLRRDVEQRGVKLVVIDSFTGYLDLVPGSTHLEVKLHEMLHYLTSCGVLVLVTVNLHGLFGEIGPEVDTSYLADTLVLMRHFEAMGSVRQCISVLKNRHGEHERSIREVSFVQGGLKLGEPLTQFTGVLTGTPQYVGDRAELLSRREDEGR